MFCYYRNSPYETEELDAGSEEKEETESAGETPFATFHHCLWFTIASWVQQGCDFLPRLYLKIFLTINIYVIHLVICVGSPR